MALPSRDRVPPALLLVLVASVGSLACRATPDRNQQQASPITEAHAVPDPVPEPPPAETPPTETIAAEVVEEPPPEPPPLFVDRANAPPFTSCRSVAHIGDSTSTGMMSDYHVRDPAQRIDAQYARVGVEESFLELFGGRSMVEHRAKHENGVMVATRLREAGFTGCWVIGLGTCDAANVAKDASVSRVERIERMMALIGDEPVLWIDTITLVEEGYWSATSMQLWNDELATTLQRYPNARIYRWSEDMRDDWFVKDGIHYTPKGYTARAKMVADALAAAFPGDDPGKAPAE